MTTRTIAVIGIGCRFPDADDHDAYWRNIARGHTSFSEIPKSRWNHDVIYSQNQRDVDKAWVNRGSFIRDVTSFAALDFGIAPRRIEVMDPQHRLLIEATRVAL